MTPEELKWVDDDTLLRETATLTEDRFLPDTVACTDCGTPLPWDGRGSKPKLCETCKPEHKRLKEHERYRLTRGTNGQYKADDRVECVGFLLHADYEDCRDFIGRQLNMDDVRRTLERGYMPPGSVWHDEYHEYYGVVVGEYGKAQTMRVKGAFEAWRRR